MGSLFRCADGESKMAMLNDRRAANAGVRSATTEGNNTVIDRSKRYKLATVLCCKDAFIARADGKQQYATLPVIVTTTTLRHGSFGSGAPCMAGKLHPTVDPFDFCDLFQADRCRSDAVLTSITNPSQHHHHDKRLQSRRSSSSRSCFR